MSGGQTRVVVTTLADPRVGHLVLQGYLDLHQRNLHNGRFVALAPVNNVVLIEASIDGRDWEGVAVAMFFLSTEHKVLWLDLIYVLEAWRGRGIARQLFDMLKKMAIDSGMLAVEYGTDVKNVSMRSVAKRLGHTEMAVLVTVPIGE